MTGRGGKSGLHAGHCALVALLAASPALAAPGDHVQFAGGEWTPSVSTGVEYHTNAFLADGVINQTTPGLSWRTHPRLSANFTSEANELHAGTGWHFNKYVDTTPDDGFNVTNLDRFSDADAQFNLSAFKNRRIGLRVDERFDSQSSPASLETAENTDANIGMLSNDLRAGLAVRPGTALEIGLLGTYGVDRYTVPDSLTTDGDANLNNRSNYGPLVDVKWRFLPKTAVTFRGSANWLTWDNNLVAALGSGGTYGTFIGKPDAFKWQAMGGLRGNLSQRIAVVAEVGYGQMTYDEQTVVDAAASLGSAAVAEVSDSSGFGADLSGLEGVSVNGMLTYALGASTKERGHTLTFGYRKDFQDAFFTNYSSYHNVNVRYEGKYAYGLGAFTDFTFRLDSYSGEIIRDDNTLKLKAGTSWDARQWLSLSGTVQWDERACADETCEGGAFYGVQYDDVSGRLGATVRY